MMGVAILFKLVIFVGAVVRGHEFPDVFKRCQLSDKSFEKCLTTAIDNAFQAIGSKGIPSSGIPSIEPVQVTSIEIGAGTSAVNLVQKYKDAKIYGFSKGKLQKAHLDMDKKVLTFSAVFPELRQDAKYSINGKILVIPVYGTGDSVIRLGEPHTEHTITFKEVTKKGKKYFHVESYKVVITSIKSAHYDFQNLFDGDKKLGDNILKVINENWNVIFDDVKEGVENAYSAVFEAVCRNFFDSVPIAEVFPK